MSRLAELGVIDILGFGVPQLFGVDEELRVIEMTVVSRPFVLDFAGAYLDFKPAFSEEIWREWESMRREEYGERWPEVVSQVNVLSSAREHGRAPRGSVPHATGCPAAPCTAAVVALPAGGQPARRSMSVTTSVLAST